VPSLAYVNGRYLPARSAAVSIADRGYQFADGVYEVVLVVNGRLLDADAHLDRLERSLDELAIPMPMARRALGCVMRRLVRINRITTGTLYLQVTRGAAPREHAFPRRPPEPALTMTVKRYDLAALLAQQSSGVAAVTVPDQRWKRCDIKSTALIGNVLAKQAAREAGATEAWMVDAAGYITEGASTTAWIVDGGGRLVTRALGPEILPGITRRVILELAEEAGWPVVERAFTPQEVLQTAEAFLASTTNWITPVVRLDDRPIGNGEPGPVSRALIDRHCAHVKAETGLQLAEARGGSQAAFRRQSA